MKENSCVLREKLTMNNFGVKTETPGPSQRRNLHMTGRPGLGPLPSLPILTAPWLPHFPTRWRVLVQQQRCRPRVGGLRCPRGIKRTRWSKLLACASREVAIALNFGCLIGCAQLRYLLPWRERKKPRPPSPDFPQHHLAPPKSNPTTSVVDLLPILLPRAVPATSRIIYTL